MGKKRRAEVLDLDAERTLYSSFVSAANSISQLYTQAVQQQRRASAAASRQTLERVLAFLLKEHAGSDSIPKAALLQFLQQEYENVEGSEHLPHQFPVSFLPMLASQQGHSAHGSQGADEATESLSMPMKPSSTARSFGGSGTGMMSPGLGRRPSSASPAFGMSAMDTADHHADGATAAAAASFSQHLQGQSAAPSLGFLAASDHHGMKANYGGGSFGFGA